jgi:hypothetical protein
MGKRSSDDSVIAKAQCKRMFQIGDRRMQSADFGNLASLAPYGIGLNARTTFPPEAPLLMA